jgi:hypothetical protein
VQATTTPSGLGSVSAPTSPAESSFPSWVIKERIELEYGKGRICTS